VTATVAGVGAARAGTVRDYVALTKPRIIELLLITTVPPMVLAAGGWPGTWLVLSTVLGGTLTAGAANAYNMVLDRDIDAVMVRTRGRPLPAGRIPPARAVLFATAIGALGVALLWSVAGPLAAAIAVAALIYYVALYTALLKRRTVQNIVIGGAAGAAPALIGWAAVTGEVPLVAWVLFTVVFLWTPPHFWALAIVCHDDYRDVAVPMLPVVVGSAETARRCWRYAVATVACSLLVPLAEPRVGVLYVVAALVLGVVLLARCRALLAEPRPRVARRLFAASIYYLGLLFGALALDQMLRW
jgi:heme o synthase